MHMIRIYVQYFPIYSQRDQERSKSVRDQEEKLIVNAWYNMVSINKENNNKLLKVIIVLSFQIVSALNS